MTNLAKYAGNQASNVPNTGRGPSPFLWEDCPWHEIRTGFYGGVAFHDDFEAFPLPGTQTSELSLGHNGYKVYNTGSGNVKTNASLDGTETMGGIISMLCDTAGDASVIGTQSCPFLLSGSASTSGPLWFEARYAQTGIATNNVQVFLGLGESDSFTYGAAKPLGDANAVCTDGPFIGLQQNEDGLGVFRGVYADEAATWTEVEDVVGTVAASTFAKVGMKYDPEDSTECVKFFFNGVQAASVISRSTLTGLTHLDVSSLGLIFAMFADSAGTATYGYLDWWRCAQLAPGER